MIILNFEMCFCFFALVTRTRISIFKMILTCFSHLLDMCVCVYADLFVYTVFCFLHVLIAVSCL